MFLQSIEKLCIISTTEPDTPLNNADHVGSFNFYGETHGKEDFTGTTQY